MKTKKIRGHKRRYNDIDHWVETHKNLNLDNLKEYQIDYAKIRVHPWSGISLTSSRKPEPTRQTKSKILSGLIAINDSWKNELNKLGENYYLKIWLFEPRFASSQVVCALGNYLDFYENTFYKTDKFKKLNLANYGQLKVKLKILIGSIDLTKTTLTILNQATQKYTQNQQTMKKIKGGMKKC